MDREHATAPFDDKVAGADWLDDLFVGPLSHWRGKLVWDGPAGATAAAELGEHHRFSAVIDRFQAAQGGPDRIAATSFWSQIYFSTLIVPAVVASLGLARNLRLGWSDMHVTLCPRSGVPLHFGMTPDRAPTLDTPLLHPLFEGHLTPFIAMVRRESGLSSRLLWENAGWVLVWILGEMGRLHPACLPGVRAILADRSWPARPCDVLEGMKRATREGLTVSRRVCCLRYRVPGFAYCEGSCPLIGRPKAGDRGCIFSPPQSSCMARLPITGPTLRRPKPRR